MYQLEKLSVENGKYSAVGAGHCQSSDHVAIFLAGKHKPRMIKDIHKIKVGWQIVVSRGVGYLQTSPVAEILDKGEDFIRFKTQTSIYELRKVTDV